jgi:hypothetical protein
MGKGKANETVNRKRRQKNAPRTGTRSKRIAAVSKAKKPKRVPTKYRKLDLKARGEKVREKQVHMEAARVECVRLGIGAVKYLDPKNKIPQLSGCPLTMTDKSRLAANIKSSRTPRMGEHMQHLTDAEELDVSIEMVSAAHSRNPRSWRSMEEVVAETISNRPNGPTGRAFTRPSKQGGAMCSEGKGGV